MNRKDVSNIKLITNYQQRKQFKHEGFVAGIPPYLRGVNSTMYINNPCKIQEVKNFLTPKEYNTFYHNKIAKGEKELVINVSSFWEIINSIEAIKVLLYELPLQDIRVFINVDKTNALDFIALYIVAIQELGFQTASLLGTINFVFSEKITSESIIKEHSSVKVMTEVLKFVKEEIPCYNIVPIISSFTKEKIQQDSPEIVLADILANGLAYLKKGVELGVTIDLLASTVMFSYYMGVNHMEEIAKMRAARMLWAKLVKQFKPNNPESLAFRVSTQIDTYDLNENFFESVTKITVDTMSAVFGGTQIVQVNSSDKIITPLHSKAHKLHVIQEYLHEEANAVKTVDPWGGSYYLEALTEKIAIRAWDLLKDRIVK